MIVLRHQQSRKIAFYIRGLAEHFLVPRAYYQFRLRRWFETTSHYRTDEIEQRVNYYNKLNDYFQIPAEAFRIDQIPKRQTAYLLDLRRALRYFPRDVRTLSRFGDKTDVTVSPSFVKARPIGLSNENSVLLRLNSIRHFRPIRDCLPFREKKDSLVWRGQVKPNHPRYDFFLHYFDHPRIDIGMANRRSRPELEKWRKPFLSIPEQLQYKFILSIEGNDVATNLKWIAQSNALCFMTKPKFESWFMEGALQGGQHYVELRDDYADLDEKMDFYLEHPDEAENIIRNLQNYYRQFTDLRKERLIALLVVEKYLRLSGQLD